MKTHGNTPCAHSQLIKRDADLRATARQTAGAHEMALYKQVGSIAAHPLEHIWNHAYLLFLKPLGHARMQVGLWSSRLALLFSAPLVLMFVPQTQGTTCRAQTTQAIELSYLARA